MMPNLRACRWTSNCNYKTAPSRLRMGRFLRRRPFVNAYDEVVILAEKIVCELVDKKQFIGECTIPPPSSLDWASALSGVVSVAIAVAFGVWSMRHAYKERKRAELAERRLRLGQISNRIIDSFAKISEVEHVQKADLPWLVAHFPDLRHALSPFGKVADDFYEEISVLALEISSYVNNLFQCDAESEWNLPAQIKLEIVDGFKLRVAVGNLRSGLNAFIYADDNAGRKRALEMVRNSKERTSLKR